MNREEKEILEEMGTESEGKGRAAVQEAGKREIAEMKKEQEDELNKFDMARKSVFTYKDMLQVALHELVNNIGMPSSYQWGVWFDGRGIIIVVKDRRGMVHKRAFRPSMNPLADQNAIKTLALWAEDIYDKCEGKLEPTIWTPKN